MARYCSLDIETTGLDPLQHNVIEFGAVLDDLAAPEPLAELPVFHCYVLPAQVAGYRGDPYALSMNCDILRKISNRLSNECGDVFLYPDEVAPAFAAWCREHGLVSPRDGSPSMLVAGKNVAGFDLPFLRAQLPGFSDIRFSQRVLDPAILYFNPICDARPPSLEVCLQRAGLNPEVPHTAVEDAKLVIQLLRHKFPIGPTGDSF